MLKAAAAMLPFLSVIVGAQFVDRALAVKAMGWRPAVFSASMLVAISFLQALGNNLYSFFRVIQRGRVYPVIEKAMTEKIACLPYSYVENDQVADLLSRVAAEPEAALSGILEKNLELWGFIAANVSLLAVLMAYAPVWLALIIAGMLVLFGRFAVKGGKKQYEAHAEVTIHRRRASYYEEIMGNRAMANERMLFGYAGEINDRFLEESRKARAKERKARFWWFLWSNAGGYAAIGISIIVILVLLKPVVRGDTSIGIFISLVTAFMSMTQVITWQFPDIVKELAKGGQALKEFGTVMDMPAYTDAEEKSFTGLTENLSFESLEFRGVSFRYPDTETDVLKDMSFRIEKGRHYAFAGRNGCGKSTVVKLILRLYEPDSGVILLNGKDIKSYKTGQIWTMFSVLFQDYARYPVSLYDNIALGKAAEKTEAGEVRSAASAAGLDSLIAGLPCGMDTELGKLSEDAVELSGGEWQRVAMARTACGTAEVRILDEPTAAMDPVQEQKVYRQFSGMHCGVTTIMITHRLGATASCDCIFVIEDGKVAEEGSHAGLMGQEGIYREMYDRQREWYL